MTQARQCLTCTFWDARSVRPNDDSDGECRRHAPKAQPEAFLLAAWKKLQADDDLKEWNGKVDISPYDSLSMLAAYWPMTTATEWCGEFQPATNTTA